MYGTFSLFFLLLDCSAFVDVIVLVCPKYPNGVRRRPIQFKFSQWNIHFLFWHITCCVLYFIYFDSLMQVIRTSECNLFVCEVLEWLWIPNVSCYYHLHVYDVFIIIIWN